MNNRRAHSTTFELVATPRTVPQSLSHAMRLYGAICRRIVIEKIESKMDELAVEIRADNQAYYKVKYTIYINYFVLNVQLKYQTKV